MSAMVVAADEVVMSHRDLIPANVLADGEQLVGILDGGDFATRMA